MNDHMNSKDLLRAAEAQILQFQDEKQNQDAFINDLMESQKLEAEELVRLTEQVWKLEAAIDKKSLINMAVKFYDVKTLADSAKFIKDQ